MLIFGINVYRNSNNYLFFIIPITVARTNTVRSTTATVAPTGVERSMQSTAPTRAQETEITAEQITTLLNDLKSRIAESAGKVMSAEISSAPTIFMAMTITAPVTAARTVL